jgi:enoyl-CoA hydratase/carnithine racemase
MLLAHAQIWEADDTVKVIAMKGSGDKAFCAGGDVVAIAMAGMERASAPGALAREFFREEYMVRAKWQWRRWMWDVQRTYSAMADN